MYASIALASLASLIVAVYCGYHARTDIQGRRWVMAGVGVVASTSMLVVGLWLFYASIAAFGV